MREYRIGDCLEVLRSLPSGLVNTCVTSPPYWGLRDYGHQGQIGLEETPDEYVERMVEVFREVRRVLRDDGTLWLNLGDSYAGSWGNQGRKQARGAQRPINKGMKTTVDDGRYPSKKSRTGAIPRGTDLKQKDLVGIPWMVAFALRADGWYLRSDIIWQKPNAMPSSVKDRPTTAHEYVFLLSKSRRYYYDSESIRETDSGMPPLGRNRRTVWTLPTVPYKGAHFATYPPALITPCILAGCPQGGTVLDPFFGSGTTGMVAESLGRGWLGIELNPDYETLIRERTSQGGLL